MRASFLAGFSTGLIMLSGFAIAEAGADPAYRADAVIAFLVRAASRPPVCIGTEVECPPMLIQRRFVLVKFQLNSTTLTPSDRESLDQFAKALRDPRLAGKQFEIDGHSDAAGGESYNLDLSQKRASAVAAYLAPLGVAIQATKAFGSARPLAPDRRSPENRRVEARMYSTTR